MGLEAWDCNRWKATPRDDAWGVYRPWCEEDSSSGNKLLQNLIS